MPFALYYRIQIEISIIIVYIGDVSKYKYNLAWKSMHVDWQCMIKHIAEILYQKYKVYGIDINIVLKLINQWLSEYVLVDTNDYNYG